MIVTNDTLQKRVYVKEGDKVTAGERYRQRDRDKERRNEIQAERQTKR